MGLARGEYYKTCKELYMVIYPCTFLLFLTTLPPENFLLLIHMFKFHQSFKGLLRDHVASEVFSHFLQMAFTSLSEPPQNLNLGDFYLES